MDLPYPTVKNNNFGNDLNQLDKLARSILLSTRDIPKQDSISKSIKSKILRAITTDNARKLFQIIEKQVLTFYVQIGTRGSHWNILHFCAKNNAHQCIQYILKTQYQEYQQQYKKLVNQKTIQGYTALVIAIINRSHKVLQKILQYGGVDIHVLDEQKMSPYEIAINYKNDKAIRLLMNYEPKIKKRDYINKQALAVPLNFPKQNYTQKITACLLNCITLGLYEHDDGFEIKQDNKIKVSNYVIEEEAIDYVPINSRKQLQGYDIQWKRASQLMTDKVTMFDSYNPFEIQQNNFTIRNCLILFQCVSQQPWIIRRALKLDRCRNNHYNVVLYPNRILEMQNIDDFIPCIKQRKSAMFLSNQQEMWPMLLQKALAKHHNSYFSLDNISPLTLLQQITGFPTLQIQLSTIQNSNVTSFLQQLASKNYLYMLKGKKGTDLYEQQEKQQCFTVLNFYQKNDQSLILVNCPFISDRWKLKSTKQALPLKLIKAHYNTHKQMCVWIEAQKMKDYFESVILSLTFQNYQRSELKIKTNQFVFFKFKIENKRDQNIFLQLSNTKTQQIYNLSKLQVIKNEGKQLVYLTEGDTKLYDPNLAEIDCQPGEYMCFYQTKSPPENIQSLLLLCWSPEMISTQLVESELGILQWLGFLKNHFFKVQQQCVLEVIDQFSLVLFRDKAKTPVLLRIRLQPDQVIQGRSHQETGFVEMVSQQNVHYCVVKKIITSDEIVFDYKKQ